jgi:hypothetical protein
MDRARLVRLVRQFPENGLKLVLEHRGNVRDVLHMVAADIVGGIDFRRLRPTKTSFVERDYSAVASDVVLTAPFRPPPGMPPADRLIIYLLLEHQSEPDWLMPLRLPDYSLQVYKYQARELVRRHGKHVKPLFDPVLPVLLYTGTRSWDEVPHLSKLVKCGQLFAPQIPGLTPRFLNLPEMPEEELTSKGGAFGQVLRLVQRRKGRPEEFAELLGEVVEWLERMPRAERLRWLELLSYVQALVYHERHPSEHAELSEVIAASVQTDEHRKEVFAMHQTIAEALKAEGRKEGEKRGEKRGELRALRQVLLRQLRQRFPALPQTVAQRVEATTDIGQLQEWIDRVLTAETVKQMGIGPTP